MRIWIEVDLADKAEPDVVAERLFEFLSDDPDDLFPEINTVDGFGVDWGER